MISLSDRQTKLITIFKISKKKIFLFKTSIERAKRKVDEMEIEEETRKKNFSLLLYVCMSVDEWEFFFFQIILLSDQQSFQSLFLNYFANVWIFHPCTHCVVKNWIYVTTKRELRISFYYFFLSFLLLLIFIFFF